MNYIFAALLQIFLIALNAIFACAEIAVISMNDTKLNLLISKGGKDAKKAKKLSKLTADPARFLSTIQVAITLAGFLGSAFAADMFAEPLVDAIILTGINVPSSVISPICVIFITLILAFFNIVFGELVPKRIAMNKAEGVAKKLTGILSVVSVIFKPIVFLLSVSTNGVLRLFGISPEDKGDEVTEEDILMMAQVSKDSGNIQGSENQLIKNIFQFANLTIGELCTHRKDIDAIFTEDDSSVWQDTIYSTSHTYYPLCDKSVDNVKYILNTKAYFRLEDKSNENVIKNATVEPTFLPEIMLANKVFEMMKETHEYFAVVLDEYGGVTGIITVHDLLEVLVGDMTEKNEKEDFTVEKIDELTWEINGIIPFYKVEDIIGIKINFNDDIDFETFNGYVYNLFGGNIVDSEVKDLSTEQLEIKVLEFDKQCIVKMQIKIKKL